MVVSDEFRNEFEFGFGFEFEFEFELRQVVN